ncbi:unnamed protein product [Linum tenue]|uniref:TIR domain-containing protein n=1 Tax=Linum tenue TaxID=586396 RepID=A0AAV0S604_9ROSI|nr:unnamed protein product [Linum tenue]
MDLKIWTIWSFFCQVAVAVAVTSLVVAVTFLLKKKKNSKPSDDTPKSSESELSGAEQQQTSSAPSSSPVEYEVFLSFRGPDVRENFADFLHKFLVRYKIRTFLDDEELRKGEKIAPSLVKAIEESKVYIPVLSPNYARSKWCLQELAQMMKCCNQGNGHIMLPIFFMVEPRDVRRQDGPYKAAFQHHRKKYDAETIDEWKEALQEVGAMKGWHITESDGGILPSIRWLRLHECSSIPIDLNLNKLVILDMHSCPVEDDWRGWGGIKVTCKLKAINLSFCGELTTAPNLSHCRSLEFIHFWTCWEMRGELHVGSFKNLKVLSLTMTKITKLNGDFARLKNLQEIVAGHLTQLEEVAALPPSLKQLALSSSRVPNLSELRDLEHLSFERCDQLEIPGDIWKLSKLTTLELWDSSFSNSGIIVSVFPSSLKSLLISGCEPLEKLPSLANLNNLKELRLMRVQVHEVQGLGDLRMLETLVISSGPNLGNLDGLENLLLLKTLKVENCCLLKELPSLSNLTKLQLLEISSCQLLSEIQGLGEPEECSLSSLYIIDCPSLEQFLDVSGLRDIEELLFFGYKQLTKVYGLEKLESLRSLSISDCTSVRELPDLSGLKNLKNLNIGGCTQLIEITGLERLASLEVLDMSGCKCIRKLPDLSTLRNLVELVVDECTQLSEVTILKRSESLRSLSMVDCSSIAQLPDLSGLMGEIKR